jgi:fructan beta-fructosidase
MRSLRQSRFWWISAFLLASSVITAQTLREYDEPQRPQFHFSPAKNWTNDPNGLVYYKGEYHLFYQYNPFGETWGHMSWGHAVSKDLVHWQHLPVALLEENGVMIFSGSAVVDWNNTSGLCRNPDPKDKSCLVAIYTGHTETNQSQHIAWSNDRGRTWTKYKGNPVLDIGYKDFRDPKVFWHAPAKKWVMVVSLSKEQKVRFYGSPDLKTWEALSDFGPAGVRNGLWECPDLFELPIEGNPQQKKWVLIVNINPGGVSGGSGGQYFIGSFDGRQFINDAAPDQKLYLDYGKDFYAAVSWSDMPRTDGRRVLLGWMTNWEYANQEPTSPWRGAMSLPRTVSLRKSAGDFILVQKPVMELHHLRTALRSFHNLTLTSKPGDEESVMTLPVNGDALELIAEIEGEAAASGFRLRKGIGEQTIVAYHPRSREIVIDRTSSGNVNFSKTFSGKHSVKLRPPHNIKLQLHIFVDRSSVEVFAGGGEAVITDRIFPDPQSQSIELFVRDGSVNFKTLRVWKLKSAWKQ